MATLILTGGGTAGHCTPNLALIPYLKNDFDKIYYIGSENGIERNIISNTDIPYFSIPTVKFNRSITLKNLTIPFTLIKAIKKAGKIIEQLKPDVIFSKGGYVSVPTVIAGSRRKIPVISHESDLTMGLANRFTARYCNKILTAFPETAVGIKNAEYCGLPLRKSLYSKEDTNNLYSRFNFNGKKPVLLITGGSQGAKAINDCVRLCLPNLLQKFDVIHICGKGNISNERKIEGYFEIEYMNKIEDAFKIASICVSRAGANTLFELLSLKLPCLIIPLSSSASRGDQVENADYFYKKGMVNVLPQKCMTPQSLVQEIFSTYNNRLNLLTNIEKNQIKDCSRKISRIITDYSR